VIYVDTSVVLAQLLAEDRCPPSELWDDVVASSRLLEYELWTRIHARGLTQSHETEVRSLLGRVAMVELSVPALARAARAFPLPVRTLDALHLSTVEFLREQAQGVKLATYNERMAEVARKMGIPLFL
jgi:predicted nucleic acid-binding protein